MNYQILENFTTIRSVREALDRGEFTLPQLTEHYLNKASENSRLNIFLELFHESALTKAREVQTKIEEGRAGKLAGLVIGLKDNICYKGHKISASSRILENFESLFSATATERLLNEDAVIIGRLNCDEFAMGSSNENSAYGRVMHPADNDRVPGGSSGGSAAAVAAGLCHAALGSDTGGSIRQPASFCGVVGFKPTYGRVSRHGLIAYASSFDQIGPITKSVEDAALILEVIAGADDYDSTASSRPVDEYSKAKHDSGKKRIGWIKDCFEREGLDPEIRNRGMQLLEQLKNAGHTVEPVAFPYLDFLVPCYYILTTAEASSNLGRYDGIHYGYRSRNATDLESTYKLSRTEGFGKEVKRRIMLGTFVLSAGYYDAYYAKGQKVRRLLRDKTNEMFRDYDFILTPSTPGAAFKTGEKGKDPVAMYLEDIFTVQANIAGIPAISLPLGKKSDDLPFGIQIMAPAFNESGLFAFSEELLSQ